MVAQTLRTVVEMGQKKLAFESSFNDSQKQLTCAVSTNGVLVFEQKKAVSKDMVSAAPGGLEKLLNQSHQNLISEVEFLFSASRKILQNPSSPICLIMGVLLLTRGFHDDAILQFQKAVDLDPANIPAVKHYGVAMTLKGDFENARHVLGFILESGTAFADIY